MSLLLGLMTLVSVTGMAVSIIWLTCWGTEPGFAPRLRALGSPRPPEKRSYFDVRIRPLVTALPRYFTFLEPFHNPARVRENLSYAGEPLNLDPNQFFGLRIFLALVMAAGGLFFFVLGMPGGPLLPALFAAGGFFLPILWLNQKVEQRQNAVSLALPDMLDLLAVSVQGGMGFDQALQTIAERMRGPLGEELKRFLQEVRMGLPRRQAYEHLASRNRSKPLQSLVASLVQAEDLGIPIAQTLQIQAAAMRAYRAQRAKELAAQASPKISLATTFIVAPSALFLLAAAILLGVFSRVGGSILGGP